MSVYANILFPWLLDLTQPKEMAEQRRLVLEDVRGQILEIGIGTGLNLPYYPNSIKTLAAIEPSHAIRRRALRRANARGISIEWHQGKGEQLPFEKDSFDTVVLVDVLCTVDSVIRVLGEAYRALKPRGRLHFLEHGLAHQNSIRKWQIRFNGLSRAIACGCELTRDIEKDLRNSSFLVEELVHVSPFSGINVLYTHIRGKAIKPV